MRLEVRAWGLNTNEIFVGMYVEWIKGAHSRYRIKNIDVTNSVVDINPAPPGRPVVRITLGDVSIREIRMHIPPNPVAADENMGKKPCDCDWSVVLRQGCQKKEEHT